MEHHRGCTSPKTSPIILTESVFITLAIAACERRHMRCYDVPSTIVNTDVDKNVLMVLKGELVEMMVHIACKYTKST
jgi:hypothetical protein